MAKKNSIFSSIRQAFSGDKNKKKKEAEQSGSQSKSQPTSRVNSSQYAVRQKDNVNSTSMPRRTTTSSTTRGNDRNTNPYGSNTQRYSQAANNYQQRSTEQYGQNRRSANTQAVNNVKAYNEKQQMALDAAEKRKDERNSRTTLSPQDNLKRLDEKYGTPYKQNEERDQKVNNLLKETKETVAGTSKQVWGGYLKALGNDSNEYDQQMMILEDAYQNGRINKETYDKNVQSLKNSGLGQHYKDWKETDLHKDFEGTFKRGSELNKEGDEQVQKQLEGKEGLEKAYLGAVGSLTGMAWDAAVGAAVPGAGLESMWARVYGNELADFGEDNGRTRLEDRRYAMAQATKEELTERMFGGIGMAQKAYGKGAVGVADKLADAAGMKLKGNVGKLASTAVRVLAGSAEENAEEAVGWLADPIINNLTYGNAQQARNENAVRENLQAYTANMSEDEVKAMISDINSEGYVDRLAKQYMDGDIPKEDAYKTARLMRDYLAASMSGDDEKAKELEDRIVEASTSGANSVKSTWDTKELLDTVASTTLLTVATGLPGSVTHAQAMNQAGSEFKAEKGIEGVKALAKNVQNVDDESLSLRAQAMSDHLENGGEISDIQTGELQQALLEQNQKDYERQQSAIKASSDLIKADGGVMPIQYSRDGESVRMTETASQKHDYYTKNAEKVIDSNKSLNIKDEERAFLADTIGGFETGVMTPSSANLLCYANTEARMLFQEATGIDIDAETVVKNRDGSVNITETNKKTKVFLFTRAAQNLVNTANEEMANQVNTFKGAADAQILKGYGGSGQAAFVQASNVMSTRDAKSYLAKADVFGQYYNAARHSGVETFEQFQEQYRNPAYEQLPLAVRKQAFEAGIEDRKRERVPVGARIENGKLVGNTAHNGRGIVDVQTQNPILASTQELFQALARITGLTIHIVDTIYDKSGNVVNANGAYSNGEIWLNINAPTGETMEYTLMHEITHAIKNIAPNEYYKLQDLIVEKWYNNDKDAFQAALDKKYAAYNMVQETDRETAIEELIASHMPELLRSESFVEEVCQDETLARTILNAIRDVLQKLRELFAMNGGFSPEYNRALLEQLDIMKEAERLFLDGLAAMAEVKAEEAQMEMSELDAKYMEAVKAGDMTTAQRMVDETATKAGFPVNVYHGTSKFGFTKLDTSFSDDGISFFATSSMNVASTYSGVKGIRGVAEKDKYDSEEEMLETLEKNVGSLSSDFADALSSLVGVRSWLWGDSVYNIATRYVEKYESSNGTFSLQDVNSDMYEELVDLWAEAYDATDLDEEYEFFYEYQESEEGEKIAEIIETLVNATIDLAQGGNPEAGNYNLALNPKGFIEVNADGALWSYIQIPKELSEDPEKIEHGKTRYIAKLAKEHGYKGVIFRGLIDNGPHGDLSVSREQSDVYIAFDPQKSVKSLDPVTYDGDGNVIPLSERFDAKNEDIRWSLTTYELGKLIGNKRGVKYNKGKSIVLPAEIAERARHNINTRYYYSNQGHDGVQLVDVNTSKAESYIVAYEDYGLDQYKYVALLKPNNKLLSAIRSVIEDESDARKASKSFSEGWDLRNNNPGGNDSDGRGRADSRVRRPIDGDGEGGRESQRLNGDKSVDGHDTRGEHERFMAEFDREYGHLVEQRMRDKGFKLSLPETDSEGNQLTEQQREYFKDSKAVDENGNLLRLYHGSQDAGFTVFNSDYGNSSPAFFFTRNKEIASSYSGTSERTKLDYNPSVEKYNEKLEFWDEEARVVEGDDGYYLEEDEDRTFLAERLADVGAALEDYYGWGDYGAANYEVYLNLTNPLIVDAQNNNWDEIPADAAGMDGDIVTTNAICEYARGNGYDGVIVKNVFDAGLYAPSSVKLSTTTDYIAFDSNQIKDADNLAPTENDDIRFSLNEPVEQKGELVALHNLGEDSLRGTLKLGGFPMPSIAVVKAAAGHNMYGEYSAVFGSKTIDPKANRNNKVYGGDAWTPTFPTVDYEIVADSNFNDYISKVEDIKNAIPSGARDVARFVKYPREIADELKHYGSIGKMKDAFMSDSDTKQTFLATKGMYVDTIKSSEETKMSDTEISLSKFLIEQLGEDTVKAERPKDSTESPFEFKRRFMDENAERIRDAMVDFWMQEIPDFSEEEARESANAFKKGDLVKLLLQARRYLTEGPVKTVEKDDIQATRAEVDKRIDENKEEYSAWLDSIFDGLNFKSGLYNGKDHFTPSGNRRSFDQLHMPLTAENVVKAMKQHENGESFFGAVFKSVAQKQFGSVGEIRADKDRLKLIDEDELKALMDSFGEREAAIITEMYDRLTLGAYDNPFTIRDHIRTSIVDSIRGKRTSAAVLKSLKEDYYTREATEEDANKILELAKDVAAVPTGYFEAKPERVVNFNEIRMLLAPDNAPADLIAQLEAEGINVKTYENGNDEDRTAKLNSMPEILFSLPEDPSVSNPMELEAPEEESILEYLAAHADEFEDAPTEDIALIESRQRRADLRAELRGYAESKNNYDPTKLTRGLVLNVKSVKDDVRNLIMDAMQNSETSKKYKTSQVELATNAVRKIFEDIKKEDYNSATITAFDTAAEIVENLDLVDDAMFAEYKRFRDYFKAQKVYVSDKTKADFGGAWTDFRKANATWLKMTSDSNDGLGIDQLWEELREKFPQLSLSDGMSAQSDMLTELADNYEDLSNYRTAYESEEAYEVIRSLAEDLYDIAYDGEAWKSFADEKKALYDEQTRALKQRHKEAVRDIAKLQKKVEKLQAGLWEANERTEHERIKGEIQKQKAVRKGEKNLKDYKTKVKTQNLEKKRIKERRKNYSRIKANYEWLASRLAHPTDAKHIPEGFRTALAEVLSTLDIQSEGSLRYEWNHGESRPAAKLRELRSQLEEIAKEDGSGYFIYDDYINSWLKVLEKKTEDKAIRELDDHDMEVVGNILAYIRRNIQNYNKTVADNYAHEVSALATLSKDRFDAFIHKRGNKKQWTGMVGYASGIINIDMVTPIDMFEDIGGGLETCYKGLRRGLDKHERNIKYIREKVFTPLLDDYKNKKFGNLPLPGSELESWRDDSQMKEITLSSGKTIQLNPSQLMSLHCLMKREQALGHILGGGIVLSETKDRKLFDELANKDSSIADKAGAIGKSVKTNTVGSKRSKADRTPIMLTQSDLLAIDALLTDEQKKVADALQSVLNTTVAEWGNETSLKLNGYRKFTEENYFPIRSDSDFLITHFDGRDSSERIKNFGFTKELVLHANNAIMVEDFFSVVADHINKMSLYNALAAPIQDFQRVYNYKEAGELSSETGETKAGWSTEQMLTNAMGSKVDNYVQQFIRDLNGTTTKRSDETKKLLNKLMANYKRAAIGGNIRVGLQQPTAIVRATAIIDPKYFKGNPLNMKATMEEMFEHCPIAEWKAMGNFQIDMTRDVESIMMGTDWGVLDTVTMGAYGWLDNVTWTAIWTACKNEVKDKHPELKEGSDEYWEAVNERASYVFDKTQVVDSVFHRSHGMRSDSDFMRLVSSFKAEPTRTWNMMRTDFLKAKALWEEGDKSEAKKLAARTLSVFMFNAALVSFAAGFADAIRGKGGDDDEDAGFLKKWYYNFLDNLKDNVDLVSSMYVIGDMEDLLKRGITGEYNSGTTFMPLEGVESLATNLGQWRRYFIGESKKSVGDLMEGTVKAVSYITGIPAGNVLRDVKATLKTVGLDFNVFAGDELENTDADQLESNGVEVEVPTLNRDYGGDPKLIKDGTLLDNILNRVGMNLSADEKKQKAYSKEQKEIRKKMDDWKQKKAKEGISVTQEEYDEHLWSLCAKGFKEQMAHGNLRNVRAMQQLYVDMGGDSENAKKRISSSALKVYKKTIGNPELYNNQAALIDYMLNDLGVNQSELSELCYKSETAKMLKAGMKIRDPKLMMKALIPLVEAGLTEEDYNRLWKNRNRGDVSKYMPEGFSDHYTWPVNGTITSYFGRRNAPTAGASSYHEAIDIAAATGTPVGAANGGVVKFAGVYGGYGNQVVIAHPDGSETYYSHLSAINVHQGDTVVQGQDVGAVGSTGVSTGPHLDFKVKVNGSWVDPLKYLKS